MDQKIYDTCLALLKEELIPALGCTEPISIAYAAAKAREVLGRMPQKIVVKCSGNIIKNVKGVTVPTTGGMRGIDTAAILGSITGSSASGLEVLISATPDDIKKTKELLETDICEIHLLEGDSNLHIIIHSYADDDDALVEIIDGHTNIVRIEKNGEALLSGSQYGADKENRISTLALLSLSNIYDFANELNISDVAELFDRQIEFNMAIAEEGLKNSYGANVGSCLMAHYGDNIKTTARALPAAGSDARMSGCTMPVVINSGSGNQGMTVSLPVIAFARHLNSGKEKLYRALAMSNLTAIHLKSGLGKLSAYCGVVSAASAAGAGIAYLHDGDFETICRTVTNTLGNVSGIVCDGAKSSCAAKIASSVDAAIMGYCMASDHQVFRSGEGLVADNVEQTISNFGRMGRDGMHTTDIEILNIMIGK